MEDTNIEEMIADAKAEEEVRAEQEKAAREDFRDTLREHLKEAFKSPRESEKVTVSLQEYVILKQKEMDLDRLLNTILDCLKLSYNNEYLRVDDNDIAYTIRALYPDVYGEIMAAELAKLEDEDN